MAENPLVTVVMPAYNHGRFVGYAIESVLNQTFTNWELIITDDASTDNTLEVIRRYQDPRIKFIEHPRNQGPSAAANSCQREARGQWISSLPSDDAYAPSRLAEQLSYLEKHPECGMVETYVRFIDEHNHPIVRKNHFAVHYFNSPERTREQRLRYFFDKGNCIAASAVMFHRKYMEAAGPLDERLLQLQDYSYWVRFVLDGCVIGTLPKPLTDYRILEKSGNLSAPSLTKYHRSVYERSHILTDFLSLKSAQTLCAIFPEVVAPTLRPEQESVWVKHQLALRAWDNCDPASRHFALETWYALFNDATQAQWLAEWDMAVWNYHAVTAQTPIGSTSYNDAKYLLRAFLKKHLPLALQRMLKRAMKELW